MKENEILLQGENIPDITLVKLGRDKTGRDLIAAAVIQWQSKTDANVFLEDGDDPLDVDAILPTGEDDRPVRLHVHRCRHVTVTVGFNGVTESRKFAPGSTITRVKKWAAIKVFGMDPCDAAEHVLQVNGGTDRPEPDTHIGALVSCGDCSLAFDLVPLKRVEG